MSVTVLKLSSGEEIIANVVGHQHLMEYLHSKYITIGYEVGQRDPEYGVIVMRTCTFEKEYLTPWIKGADPKTNEFFIPGRHIMFELKKEEIDDILYRKYIAYMETWK